MMKIIALCLLLTFLTNAQEIIEKPDFAKYYREQNVHGCFLLFDAQNSKTYIYNPSLTDSGFLPASTFKILNSLIFLETKVLPDANTTVTWDGVKRRVDAWNKSQNLREAFANSTVWIYQKYAKEVGPERMKQFLHSAHFGNESIGGGIDRFWLDGDLRITPREQMDFLIRFYNRDLPFSKAVLDTVNDLFIYRQKDSVIYRGKTGWGFSNDIDLGWWIGYLTIGERVYFYVNFVKTDIPDNPKFSASRKTITENIFNELGILRKGFFE